MIADSNHAFSLLYFWHFRVNSEFFLEKLVKMAEPQNEQDAQTLFVRGITDEVDEEILFELFQNVSIISFKKIQWQNQDQVCFSKEMFVRDAMIRNSLILFIADWKSKQLGLQTVKGVLLRKKVLCISLSNIGGLNDNPSFVSQTFTPVH